jgi:hypothetical protein
MLLGSCCHDITYTFAHSCVGESCLMVRFLVLLAVEDNKGNTKSDVLARGEKLRFRGFLEFSC